MFNVGGGELLVILVVALIVLGPAKLPDAARQMGRAMNELRKLSSGFQREMRQAFEETTETQARVKGKEATQQSTAAAAGMYDDADRVRTGSDGAEDGATDAAEGAESAEVETADEPGDTPAGTSDRDTTEPTGDASEPDTADDADAPGG